MVSFRVLTKTLLGIVALSVMAACGGDQGIQEPLLPPDPAPSVTPVTGNDFATVRGNYFLLESNCPQDDSALQVAQEQESVFMTGGFNFNNDEFLLGFVDENAVIRFFGGDNDSDDPNCTAQVTDDTLMHGTCTHIDGIESTTCRFVYSKVIEGDYQPVFNDCDNDGTALLVRQTDNEVTLTNGFDYIKPGDPEVHNGVIESGKISFNIDVINPNAGLNDPVLSDQFNCEASVNGNTLSGLCRDLTVNPATVCTFAFENTVRAADVDLGDDSLFPSPAVTPSPTPATVTNINGSYAQVTNDCEDDGSNINVSQSGSTLGFVGGFDYQSQAPDLFAGTMDSNADFSFSVLGSSERAFCDADVTFNSSGIAGFSGSCNVVDTNGAAVETCTFSYSRL